MEATSPVSSSSPASLGTWDLGSAISDVRYTTHGGLFRPDYEYLMGELDTLQKSGVLFYDRKSRLGNFITL